MRGHIKRRGPSSWSVVISLGRDAGSGKWRYKWVTVRGRKQDAERELARLLAEHGKGVVPAVGRVTVAEWLETWLREIVGQRNRRRSADNYRSLVRTHLAPGLGRIPVHKLEAADIDGVLRGMRDRGLSRTTVRHAYVALRKALKDAMRRGLISRNPCDLVDAPRNDRYEVHAPSPAAIVEILAAAQRTRYWALFTFMAFTGVRRSEALALRWQNVDLERAVVSIIEAAHRHPRTGIVMEQTKSAAGRRGIALDPQTVVLLGEHKAEQLRHSSTMGNAWSDRDLVFPGELGLPMDPDAVSHGFGRTATQAGHPQVRLHDLRHAHASGLTQAGIHPRVVQERLGHSSAAFTMQVYGHVAAGLQAEAAKAFANLMVGGHH